MSVALPGRRARAGRGPAALRARPAAGPPARPRSGRRSSGARNWKKNAETTAAIGMPKIGPGDARDPRADQDRAEDHDRVDADRVLHDPRLEHVHDHDPADAHEDDRGERPPSAGGQRATMTGGAHDRNGPKNGIAWRTPADDRRQRGERQAEQQVRRRARSRKYTTPISAWPRRNPPNERDDRRLEQPRLLRVGRRDEPEQERQDLVAVDDHVDRQEEHDQHRPDRAEAGDGDRLERLDELRPRPGRGCRGRRRPGPRGRPGRARSTSSQVLPRRQDRRQVGPDVGDRGRRTGRSRSPARRRRRSTTTTRTMTTRV